MARASRALRALTAGVAVRLRRRQRDHDRVAGRGGHEDLDRLHPGPQVAQRDGRRGRGRPAGARDRGLAHAVRQQRHLLAEVRPDDQHLVQFFHVLDGHSQPRIQRVCRLSAKVAATQAVVDILATQMLDDATEQVALLHRRAGGNQGSQ